MSEKRKDFGNKICDIVHFYEGKRSNSLQVFMNDPYLKDSKWLTSGSISLMNTKFGEQNVHATIRLTFAETTELITRLQKAIDELIEKEKTLSNLKE